jgi:hypothetical protein
MNAEAAPTETPPGEGSEAPAPDAAYRIETMERAELVGRRARLSDGREGEIVHVEYDSPERVALVKTYPEDPCPLTRVGVDRLSPPHLPYIVELILGPAPEGKS